MRRAVFLDRDGTLIRMVDLLTQPAQVELMADAAHAVGALHDAGFLVVVATNQPVVAHGLCTEAAVDTVHAHIQSLLARSGCAIDAFYVCPHHPQGAVPAYTTACECRKPAPGLLLRAARDLDVDLAASVMVGDRVKDVEAGRGAGCHTVLVGPAARTAVASTADVACDDLTAATRSILLRWRA